jgi:hypothetical protein
MSRVWKKRPAAARGRPGNDDPARSEISSPENNSSSAGQLVDRYGHTLSESVLENWSAAALKALGVHRRKDQ